MVATIPEEGPVAVRPPLLDLKVLIVDDEVAVVEELAFGLRRRAFNVVTATSGDDAWAMLERADDIGVAVCDIRMPGLDGHALVQRIGAAGRSTEIVLISGHATSEDEAIARQAGVSAFLRKPFLGSELRAAVRQALASSLARRQGDGKAVNA
jgi:CheY-like chemotaxis protein